MATAGYGGTATAAAAAAAWGARAAAEAEHQAIADHVRAEITYAQIETGLRARLEAL